MMDIMAGQKERPAPNIVLMDGKIYAPPWIFGADVAFRVLDDSMTPHIGSGFIVFVRNGKQVQGGQMGAVYVDEQPYLGRIWNDRRLLILVYDNRKFERQEIHKMERRVFVVGPVAGWLSLEEQERIKRGSIHI